MNASEAPKFHRVRAHHNGQSNSRPYTVTVDGKDLVDAKGRVRTFGFYTAARKAGMAFLMGQEIACEPTGRPLIDVLEI